MEHLEESVRDLILFIVNEAMEKQDRYVTITFHETGPMVTIYPLTEDDGGEHGEHATIET